jgi:hypothetical protein
MPILNYTTTIAVHKTAGEIQEILARAGASRVMIEYDNNRQPSGVSFVLDVEGSSLLFRLPSRWKGVYLALNKANVERKFRTEDQARRVAWRIIKDWTEAQLAIIEAGQAEISEVFLPYLVNPKNDQTLFENFKANHLLQAGE